MLRIFKGNVLLGRRTRGFVGTLLSITPNRETLYPFIRYASLRMLMQFVIPISSDFVRAGLNYHFKRGARRYSKAKFI